VDDVIGPIWTHWHGHTEVLLGLIALEGAYLLGVGPLRDKYNLADAVDPKSIATFTMGVLVIFVALLSPIHILSDNYLFSAHMFQHVLLTLVAPPLLILGTPDWLLRPLLRPNIVFRAARIATHPFVAFGAFNLIFSLWHVPALYATTANYHLVHILEHLLFIGTAILMWWPLASKMPELPRAAYPIQLIYMFALTVAPIILFAAVTFASEPLYETYVNAPRVWGISPLVDQQLGAILMKIGGGILFLTLFVIVFFQWFNQEEQMGRIERDRYSDIRRTELEEPL